MRGQYDILLLVMGRNEEDRKQILLCGGRAVQANVIGLFLKTNKGYYFAQQK